MTDNVLSLSSIPLHTQLRDVLRARILDGEYPVSYTHLTLPTSDLV